MLRACAFAVILVAATLSRSSTVQALSAAPRAPPRVLRTVRGLSLASSSWSGSSSGSSSGGLLRRSSTVVGDDEADRGGSSWAFVNAAVRRCANLVSKLATQPSFRQELLDMCTVRWLSVFRNIRAGEAGRRGEEWLVAQLFLLAFITMGINPIFVFCIRLLGLGVGAFGAYMWVRSSWVLKENLSPFVVPVYDNYLVTTDLYEVVRHPQYGGLILFCVGFSLVTNSCDRLIFTLVLAALLGAKADREDQGLAARHPALHAAYLGRTERKFIPYVL